MLKKSFFFVLSSLILGQQVFSYQSTTNYHSDIATASERIILLMKTTPSQFTYDRINDFLSISQTGLSSVKATILQDIQTNIYTFYQCRKYSGERISSSRECEYIEQDVCENILGGSYNACASACRHMQDTICTLECIPVCLIQ